MKRMINNVTATKTTILTMIGTTTMEGPTIKPTMEFFTVFVKNEVMSCVVANQ